jgi:DNA modification methylase
VKNIKTISIKCDCKDFLKLEDMTVMQGGLKARDDSDYEKIKKSILTYSFSFPFFIWKSGKTNYLIDGTGRFNCLLKMQNEEGYLIPELPVVYIQCKNKTEAKQKLLRLNSQYGKMTKESVLEFASDIDLNFDEIALPDTTICFEDEQETQETEGDDEVPDIDEKEKPNSERGCLYELGNSILMCGDSTSAEDVARLMGGEKADMVFTDPPYNMSDHLTGFANEKTKKALSTIVDFDPSTIKDILLNLGTKNIYIFTSKNLIPNYFDIFKEWDFNILVWCKDNPTPMTNYTFLPDIEYLLYFHKKGGVWNNGLDISCYRKYYNGNKMEGRQESGDVHPTIKPLRIIEDKIKISSKKNGIVLDLFGGSGSTLIASEKNGRKARIMELDERYCDVIRRRYTKWAKENGKPITSGCLE